MRYTKCCLIAMAGVFAWASAAPARNSNEARTEKERLENAGKVMHEVLNVPDDIPQDLLDKVSFALKKA